MDNTNWDFDTFLAFVLIYASHADMEFTEDEKVQIKKYVSPEKFKELHTQFKNLTDFQVLQLILSYKDKYFSSEAEKEHLLTEMKKLFNSDGQYTMLEKELLMFFNKLL